MIRRRRVLVAALLLAGASIAPANAAPPASQWAETEQTAVRLIAATEAVGTTETIPLGLEFRLEKDWKIYWRSPGDAGFPPRPDWSGSENLSEAKLSWPVPARFSVLGLETLGYEDAVVLPIAARLERPGQSVRLRASVDYLTCKEICIPYTAELALDLPRGEAGPSPFAHLINRFAVRVPGNGAAHGLSIQRVEALGAGSTAALRVVASSASPFSAPDVFVEGPPELVFNRPDVLLEQAGRVAVATLGVHGLDRLKLPLTALPLTVTLADGPRGAERTVVPVAATGGGKASLAVILGLALLGGLILNLMPCVLPVLSIKLLGVVSHGGRAPGEVRLSFIATAAGIVFSFLVLAAGLIGVKAAGGVIGWGIQFQQPSFLVAMAVIVTLFAGNLWGFFEIRLPAALGGLGGPSTAGGLGASFLTGAFATLLATPCSAPFLGTAVAFALARGAGEILLVFTALGLGLALPYLLVAAVPAMATRLPKPGPWMIWLRRVLGFALAATAAWLVTVLAGILGPAPSAAIAFVLAVIIGFLAAGHHFGGPFRAAAMVAVAGLTAIAFVVPISAGGMSAAARPSALAKVWQPFDEAAIGGLVEKGNVVFVDVTADWCVTCQINKTFVLGREAIVARLGAPPVLAMEADWTRPNTDIARYLASFGRYGIPFNVVYGPRAPQGLVLPELLSEAAVLGALEQAAAPLAN
ncbi:MAG: thioredoxin family protein [Rhodospirillales bacterium]|nr:thioredoxin family protein [Rhodospirillales bacterium]